jgi:hypothetical protein
LTLTLPVLGLSSVTNELHLPRGLVHHLVLHPDHGVPLVWSLS